MFSLKITQKDGASTVRQFNKPEVTIGRVAGNDLVLPKSNISARHARILFKSGVFTVIDNKSTNGTCINGRRVTEPYDMQEGDKIFVGDFIIETMVGAVPGAIPATDGAQVPAMPGFPAPQPLGDSKTRPIGPGDPFGPEYMPTPALKPKPAADDFDDDWDTPMSADAAPESVPGPVSPAGGDAADFNEDWDFQDTGTPPGGTDQVPSMPAALGMDPMAAGSTMHDPDSVGAAGGAGPAPVGMPGPGPAAPAPGLAPLGGPGPAAPAPGLAPLGGPGPAAPAPGLAPLGGPGPSPLAGPGAAGADPELVRSLAGCLGEYVALDELIRAKAAGAAAIPDDSLLARAKKFLAQVRSSEPLP